MSKKANTPPGWQRVQMGQLGVLHCGQSPPSATVNTTGNGTPYVTGPEQWDGSEVHLDKWTTSPKRIVPAGCMFITVKGAGVGTIFPGVAAAIGRDVYAFQSAQNLDETFIRLGLHHSVQDVLRHARGSIPGLSKSHILDHEIGVPPLNEQRRIVAKLDACMAHTKKAKQALDAIPPLLEKFRQSVLAAAFRGDLTKDWREKNPDVEPIETAVDRVNVKPPRSGRNATIAIRKGRSALSIGDPETTGPSGWRWIPLIQVARLESGHTPSRKRADYWDGPIKWVGIKDARDSHGSVINDTYQSITQLGLDNSAARLLPAQTVCLVRTAASIGYVTVLGRDMATSQDLVNWVCSEAIVPEYLMYLLIAEKQSILSFGKGSAHRTVYYPEVKAFHVCLPPVAEQNEIVSLIRARLAGIDQIKETFELVRNRSATIDRCILAKAFRGELVPQDPNDEPASVLLERIRAERATQEKAKPKKKRKTRAKRGAAR